MNWRGFTVIGSFFLVLLFLLSSTDLIIKETEPPIYSISILFDSSNDADWENFRSGADRAAVQFNADISFITAGHSTGEAVESADRISREINNHANGLAIIERDIAVLQELLSNIPSSIPVVAISSTVKSPRIKANISPNWEKLAQDLAHRVIAENPSPLRITFVQMHSTWAPNQIIQSTMEKALEENGAIIDVQHLDSVDQSSAFLHEVYDAQHILISIEADLLSSLAEAQQAFERPMPLYGIGWNHQIWTGIENGTIQASAVTDGFSSGFYTVKMLTLYLNGKASGVNNVTISHGIVGKNELYIDPYQKMLFPVT